MSTSGSSVAESTPSSLFLFDPQTPATSVFSQTPATSVYSPTDEDDPLTPEWKPLEKLNSFLESRDISPVRHPMKTQWEEASERTKRRHTRKAKQAVDAVLDEVAPNQSDQLWQSLATSKSLGQHPFSTDDEERTDEVLMQALAECIRNANNWQTRRQILSIMADKVSYKALQKWIPNLTRYRFSEARKHILVKGRGVTPSLQSPQTRMPVSQTQLDHFLQYLTYSKECGFTPLSRRTLLRILTVGSASVRKSLQGLDYISSAGSQAFDDLADVVNRLGDEVMGMTWAREQKERESTL